MRTFWGVGEVGGPFRARSGSFSIIAEASSHHTLGGCRLSSQRRNASPMGTWDQFLVAYFLQNPCPINEIDKNVYVLSEEGGIGG